MEYPVAKWIPGIMDKDVVTVVYNVKAYNGSRGVMLPQ